MIENKIDKINGCLVKILIIMLCFIFGLNKIAFAYDENTFEIFKENTKNVVDQYKGKLNISSIGISDEQIRIVLDNDKQYYFKYDFNENIYFESDLSSQDEYSIILLMYLYSIAKSSDIDFDKALTYILSMLVANEDLETYELKINTISENIENIYNNEEIKEISDEYYVNSFELYFDHDKNMAYIYIHDNSIEDLANRLYELFSDKDLIFQNSSLEEETSFEVQTQEDISYQSISQEQSSDNNWFVFIVLFSILILSVVIYFIIIVKHLKRKDDINSK